MTAVLAGASVCRGESPQPEPSPSAVKASGHSKPQIIYHLSGSSRESSETLHAQSKASENLLDVSPNMPISLQLARANANAAARAVSPAEGPSDANPARKAGSRKKARSILRQRGNVHGHSAPRASGRNSGQPQAGNSAGNGH